MSYTDNSGYKPLEFWTQNTPRMKIWEGGTVGIGTETLDSNF